MNSSPASVSTASLEDNQQRVKDLRKAVEDKLRELREGKDKLAIPPEGGASAEVPEQGAPAEVREGERDAPAKVREGQESEHPEDREGQGGAS